MHCFIFILSILSIHLLSFINSTITFDFGVWNDEGFVDKLKRKKITIVCVLLTKYEIMILKYYRGLAKTWETRKKQKSKEFWYKNNFCCLFEKFRSGQLSNYHHRVTYTVHSNVQLLSLYSFPQKPKNINFHSWMIFPMNSWDSAYCNMVKQKNIEFTKNHLPPHPIIFWYISIISEYFLALHAKNWLFSKGKSVLQLISLPKPFFSS